jgi:cysteine desulfurase family protein (TIGR01976 family)
MASANPIKEFNMPRQAKAASSAFDVNAVRKHFPALRLTSDGKRPVYFDNPGGTQVAQGVLDSMRDYLIRTNSNTHGSFATSRATDETIHAGRESMADFLNAPSPDQIVFGANMTTLTFHISRSIGQTLARGSQIILTRMDHDANISPWLLLARDHGLKILWADFDPATGRLDVESITKLLTPKTKLIACSYASNALGTINDVKRITEIAHSAGAMVYIDAVHYVPHGPIDVQALDCDFLACSAYKFFGPHIGILYGKREHLESLPAYKVRPAADTIPDRWETGTKNHEGIAGTKAAIDYFEWVGETFGEPFAGEAKGLRGRKRKLKMAMMAIKAYEQTLSERLIDGLSSIKGISIAGITDKAHLDERVPTVSFSVKSKSPALIASELGQKGIYVWDGNFYALEVMERLGREAHGGMVRVGAAHYNTLREVNRFLKELDAVTASGLKVVSTQQAAKPVKSKSSKPAPKKSKPQPSKRTRTPKQPAEAPR